MKAWFLRHEMPQHGIAEKITLFDEYWKEPVPGSCILLGDLPYAFGNQDTLTFRKLIVLRISFTKHQEVFHPFWAKNQEVG